MWFVEGIPLFVERFSQVYQVSYFPSATKPSYVSFVTNNERTPSYAIAVPLAHSPTWGGMDIALTKTKDLFIS
jgi:hypothetical protein